MVRSQGYDGAANMAGVRRGVQARIRQQIHGAIYLHCKGHNVLRSQGYVGAANMAGVLRGVQARIRQQIHGAIYMHCKGHDGHTPTDRLLVQLLS